MSGLNKSIERSRSIENRPSYAPLSLSCTLYLALISAKLRLLQIIQTENVAQSTAVHFAALRARLQA